MFVFLSDKKQTCEIPVIFVSKANQIMALVHGLVCVGY